jgi:hypothetical protein
MKSIGFILGGMFIIVIALFFVGFILAFPIMLLWNWLMPELFDLPTIGYWQSFGLFYLSGLLIKPFTPVKNKD